MYTVTKVDILCSFSYGIAQFLQDLAQWSTLEEKSSFLCREILGRLFLHDKHDPWSNQYQIMSSASVKRHFGIIRILLPISNYWPVKRRFKYFLTQWKPSVTYFHYNWHHYKVACTMKIHTRILELSMILISHFIVLDLIPKLSISHICKSPISSVIQHNAEWSNKTVLPLNSQTKKPQLQEN